MIKPHPVELRDRSVRLVGQGITHTVVALRPCVSIKLVHDIVRLQRLIWRSEMLTLKKHVPQVKARSSGEVEALLFINAGRSTRRQAAPWLTCRD